MAEESVLKTAGVFARIEAGIVVNLELWVEPPELEDVLYVRSDDALIGDTHDWFSGEFDRAPPSPPRVPEEVAMHRVEKAAIITSWDGFDNLKAAIEWGIGQLPTPKNLLAMTEWMRAPNMQRHGVTTLAIMDLIGMSPAQRDELLLLAASLP
jgi:hypothetical protein